MGHDDFKEHYAPSNEDFKRQSSPDAFVKELKRAESVHSIEVKPWELKGQSQWSNARIALAKFFASQVFQAGQVIVILFNVVVIVTETDTDASCYPAYSGTQGKPGLDHCPTSSAHTQWVVISNQALLVIYSLEALLLLYAERMSYFYHKENILDVVICVAGWFSICLEYIPALKGRGVNISWLRVFRIARIFRAMTIVNSIPELYSLISGLKGSMRAVFFGGCLLASILCLISVVITQFIHPVNADIDWKDSGCERCPRGYSTVWNTFCTLYQQIVAGDSWGLLSLPVLEETCMRRGGTSCLVGLLLPLVQMLVGMGLMNLILAVVVDRAVEARDQDKERKVKQMNEEREKQHNEIQALLEKMDEDRSGALNRSEIEEAYRTSSDFRNMLHSVDVRADELFQIVELLEYGQGVDIANLCDVLDEFHAADVRKICVLNFLHNKRFQKDVKKRLQDAEILAEKRFNQSQAKLDAILDGMGIKSKTVTPKAHMVQKIVTENRSEIVTELGSNIGSVGQKRSNSRTTTSEVFSEGDIDLVWLVERPVDSDPSMERLACAANTGKVNDESHVSQQHNNSSLPGHGTDGSKHFGGGCEMVMRKLEAQLAELRCHLQAEQFSRRPSPAHGSQTGLAQAPLRSKVLLSAARENTANSASSTRENTARETTARENTVDDIVLEELSSREAPRKKQGDSRT